MKIEIEKIKETDFSKIEADLKKIKPEVEKSLKDAKKSIDKAKMELQEYKTFIDELEKDGLINKKENYSVEHQNGLFKINDKTQPAGVYNKYKSFLKKHKDFKMKKEDDGFEIE
jgi:esterase/lipase